MTHKVVARLSTTENILTIYRRLRKREKYVKKMLTKKATMGMRAHITSFQNKDCLTFSETNLMTNWVYLG